MLKINAIIIKVLENSKLNVFFYVLYLQFLFVNLQFLEIYIFE